MIRVWYDRKRGHYVSDVGFILGKKWGIHPYKAGLIFDQWLKSQPDHELWELVEETWVS